jgi:phosphatidylglycerophosphate synthase
MTNPRLSYTVTDRSLLLPSYKRFVIGPTVPLIPRRLNPNAITHGGHVINLIGFVVLLAFGQRSGGWPFFFAMAMVQLYNWCDNADGAHARATGQCSAMGEFLDHGLDLFNATYIAAMAAMAVGASPVWTFAMVIVVVGAAAATYWEQAESGVFQLGWLNQIESVFALSLLLTLGGLFGVDIFATKVLGPISVRGILMVFLCGNALLSILQGPYRVWRRGGKLTAFLPLLGFGVAVFLCAATGALSALAATIIGVAGYVFLGVRSLAIRLQKRRPPLERGVVLSIGLLAALLVYRAAGGPVGVQSDVLAVISALFFFGAYAALNLRDATRVVKTLDAAKA